MDEWYDIGAHIKCKTCLGQEISGILVAYDIDQKLMFLKRTNPATKPSTETITDQGLKNSTTNTSSQMSQSTTSLLPPSSSFVSNSPTAKPYVLLNLRFISEITEVADEESRKDASLVNAYIESENSITLENNTGSSKDNSKDVKNNSTNTNAKSAGDFSMDTLDKKQQDVINSVNPSSKLDMDKER